MGKEVIVKNYLSKDEIKDLMLKSDWKAALEFAHTWLWIAFAFAIAGFLPNPLTIIIALFIIGGKQLGCAILMHDASHHSMFRSRKANEWVGSLLGAWPIFHDLYRYRPYHLKHHVTTGTEDDPDLPLTFGYPATQGSMTRKILRDLMGLTGLKGYFGLFAMHFDYLKYNLGGKVEWSKEPMPVSIRLSNGLKKIAGPVAFNAALYLILWLCGAGWLYLLWIGAMLTTFQFSLRIRSIAEHSVVPDPQDDHKNTRTTYANFFEKILFAPHHVNYHAEHHLVMTVPSYNLPRMHQILRQRGYFEDGVLENNYLSVMQLAIKGS